MCLVANRAGAGARRCVCACGCSGNSGPARKRALRLAKTDRGTDGRTDGRNRRRGVSAEGALLRGGSAAPQHPLVRAPWGRWEPTWVQSWGRGDLWWRFGTPSRELRRAAGPAAGGIPAGRREGCGARVGGAGRGPAGAEVGTAEVPAGHRAEQRCRAGGDARRTDAALGRSPAARPSHPTSRQRGAGPGAASRALRPCPEADVTEGGGRPYFFTLAS